MTPNRAARTRRPNRTDFDDAGSTGRITVARLLRLTTPGDFAEWYAAGRAYTRRVAVEMEFAGATRLDGDRIAARLAADPSSLSSAAARSVATTLVADGVFSEPYCEWMPLWYELALLGPVRYADWRLGRVARAVAAAADVTVSTPRFSRPRDVVVDGHPPLATVSGFRDRFVLAAALLHLEWFVHVAAADGSEVLGPRVARTRAE